MDYSEKIITDIELHSVEGIRNCFKNGVSPNQRCNNEPLIYELTGEYTRSPRFKDCVKIFVDHGLKFDDNALLAVLQGDSNMLEREIAGDTSVHSKRDSLRCAYTPLYEVSLLHISAEFNHAA